METETKTERDESEQAGRGQLEAVKEMVAALRAADEKLLTERAVGTAYGCDVKACEDAKQAIHEDALSVEVRSGWYDPCAKDADKAPADFRIVLGFGGPNVEIVGTLDADMEPERATLRHSWATPWADLPISGEDEDALLEYSRCFFFGE